MWTPVLSSQLITRTTAGCPEHRDCHRSITATGRDRGTISIRSHASYTEVLGSDMCYGNPTDVKLCYIYIYIIKTVFYFTRMFAMCYLRLLMNELRSYSSYCDSSHSSPRELSSAPKPLFWVAVLAAATASLSLSSRLVVLGLVLEL